MVAGELAHDEHAQLQTLEGFAAALLMVGTVYLVVTAVTMSVPQTELHVDAQLKTYGRDALAILDASLPPEKDGDYYASLLKNSVVDWVNGVAGATSWETEEFTPKNPDENKTSNKTSYQFKFRTPSGCNYEHTFYEYIPNNTRISHAYVTLTGMPRLDTDLCTDTYIDKKLPLVLNTSSPDRFGCSIAHGDVNGDGVSDMVVGAYGNNSDSGAVYVYYGNESGVGGWEDGPNVTILNPGASGDRFGWAVACGDVNNDTVDDVIVGAHENDTTDTGVVYVYYGGVTPLTHPDATIDNPRGTGNSSGWFGYSLACGDVNGDSCDDILIGAPTVRGEGGAHNCGNAFVYPGGNPFNKNDNITLYNPYNSSDFFGISVACFDINEDDKDDIIIGANATNRTYIRFGSASLPQTINTGGNEMNLTLYDDKSNSEFGISISSAGDVNNDGADDLIVGAPDNDSAHIFYGGSLLDECADINLTGDSGFGRSVSASGDVDGDGYAGVIVGTSDDEAGVFYDVDLDVGPVNISESDAGFGSVVSDIGDVNNDTIPDIAVGAPDDGRVYVYTPMFPEEPWLAVGNETDLANGNGTKVWEYTTVIKTDNSNCTDGDTPPAKTSILAGNSTGKNLSIYREIDTDAVLSMYVKTGSGKSADVRISVNGVEVNASSPAINTSGNWTWHNITLLEDITEWRIGNNMITINVTSDSDTLNIGEGKFNKLMIRIILPITQPFKTTETTPDFADAINDWMDTHPLNNVTTYLLTGLPKYQWINLSTNETGWVVPFLLHSNSSGVINVTNLYIKATPSLDENLDALLPNFIEYNVIFAYLDTLTKGHLYTFSDGNYTEILDYTDDVIKNEEGNLTVHILLPENTTAVYQANMDVTGLPYEPIETDTILPVKFAQDADAAIVVDSNGNVHIAYSRNRPQLYYINNEDGGWTDPPGDINKGGGNTSDISLTVDTNDELHATFTKGVANPNVHYSRTYDGEWLSSTIEVNDSSKNEPSYDPSQPCIAVDSKNAPHIVWIENTSIYYSENTTGTWSPAVQLNDTINATDPLFDIDSDDIKHIAFLENRTVYYTNTSGGNWSTPAQVDNSTNASDISMSIDFHGYAHLAWVENGTTLYYSNNTGGFWYPKDMVNNGTAVSEPSLDTDYTGNAYIVWADSGYINYSTNAAESWSEPMELGGGGAINPSVCIDIHGNIHIIWSEDGNLHYYGYALYYPTRPYIIINNSTVWEYNITEINHNDTKIDNDTKIGEILLGDSDTDAIYKNFVIDEEITGPSYLSIYVKGGDGSIDIYINDKKVRSTFIPLNASFVWRNITIPAGAWHTGTNELRINGSSINNSYGYAKSDDVDDYYYNNGTMDDSFEYTWMIRLYAVEYHGAQTIDDFSESLNAYISTHNASAGYYNTTFTVHSDTMGRIKLSRLRIYYYIRGNATHVTQKRIITNGIPPSDSVTTTKLITIQDGDIPNSTEARNDAEDRMPDASISPDINLWNLVEVRLELWYE